MLDGNPTDGEELEDEARLFKRQVEASIVIQRWFRSRYQKEIFQRLKASIRLIESVPTSDVIRLLNCTDAAILLDPSIQSRVRFRFGGTQFPPFIYYKLFIESPKAVHLDGKTAMQSSSTFMDDAGKAQGVSQFNLTLWESECADANMGKKGLPTDSLPAYLGGKSNQWRLLSQPDPISLIGASPSYLCDKTIPPIVLGEVDDTGVMQIKASYSRALIMSHTNSISVVQSSQVKDEPTPSSASAAADGSPSSSHPPRRWRNRQPPPGFVPLDQPLQRPPQPQPRWTKNDRQTQQVTGILDQLFNRTTLRRPAASPPNRPQRPLGLRHGPQNSPSGPAESTGTFAPLSPQFSSSRSYGPATPPTTADLTMRGGGSMSSQPPASPPTHPSATQHALPQDNSTQDSASTGKDTANTTESSPPRPRPSPDPSSTPADCPTTITPESSPLVVHSALPQHSLQDPPRAEDYGPSALDPDCASPTLSGRVLPMARSSFSEQNSELMNEVDEVMKMIDGIDQDKSLTIGT